MNVCHKMNPSLRTLQGAGSRNLFPGINGPGLPLRLTTLTLAWILLFGCTTGPPGSPHPNSSFLLYTSAPSPQAQDLGHTAQTFLEHLGKYLDILPPPGGLLRIHQYRWRFNFWRHLNGSFPSLRWKKGACFEIPDAYIVALYGRPLSKKTMETLRHELTHYLLTIHFSHVPPWLDEGLSQIMACGPPLPHIEPGLSRTVRGEIKRVPPGTCKHLLLLPPCHPLTRNQYHSAFLLTDYLLTRSPESRERLLCFLDATRPGYSPGKVFQACWGVTMEEACSELAALNDQSFPPVFNAE